jgi:hypothetical protein
VSSAISEVLKPSGAAEPRPGIIITITRKQMEVVKTAKRRKQVA